MNKTRLTLLMICSLFLHNIATAQSITNGFKQSIQITVTDDGTTVTQNGTDVTADNAANNAANNAVVDNTAVVQNDVMALMNFVAGMQEMLRMVFGIMFDAMFKNLQAILAGNAAPDTGTAEVTDVVTADPADNDDEGKGAGDEVEEKNAADAEVDPKLVKLDETRQDLENVELVYIDYGVLGEKLIYKNGEYAYRQNEYLRDLHGDIYDIMTGKTRSKLAIEDEKNAAAKKADPAAKKETDKQNDDTNTKVEVNKTDETKTDDKDAKNTDTTVNKDTSGTADKSDKKVEVKNTDETKAEVKKTVNEEQKPDLKDKVKAVYAEMPKGAGFPSDDDLFNYVNENSALKDKMLKDTISQDELKKIWNEAQRLKTLENDRKSADAAAEALENAVGALAQIIKSSDSSSSAPSSSEISAYIMKNRPDIVEKLKNGEAVDLNAFDANLLLNQVKKSKN